jgi:hypothetical protein
MGRTQPGFFRVRVTCYWYTCYWYTCYWYTCYWYTCYWYTCRDTCYWLPTSLVLLPLSVV